MSIDCCKSYVGKQIIGLLPSGGSTGQKCLWLGTVDDRVYSYEIVNPSASWSGDYWENGVAGQGVYQSDMGVFGSVNSYEPTAVFIWSLEDSGTAPVGWTGNGLPIDWSNEYCDISTDCYRTQGTFDPTSGVFYISELILANGFALNFSANGLDSYNINDPIIIDYLQGIFGGQASITIDLNFTAGTFSIVINNSYVSLAPSGISLIDGVATTNRYFTSCDEPKCIVWSDNIVTADDCSYNGFYWSINNSIYPTTGNWYEIGSDIQTQYQLDAGGSVLSNLAGGGLDGCSGFLWSLEKNPIGTNWQVMTSDTFITSPINWTYSCDLTQDCYEVDLPVSINDPVLDFVFTSPNGNITYQNTTLSLNDPNFITFLQSIFGGQATITVTDNITSVYIKIENCYIAIAPVSIEIQSSGTFNFTNCTP
jgi:hypothetical protein